MKKLVFLIILLMGTISISYAQSEKPQQMATSTIANKDARFLLFPTQNIHIFLKLNTQTGEVYIVQFSTDGKGGEVKIENYNYPLVTKEEQTNGRFFLYPTKNFYNFLLMDQIDGRIWQLQWGFEEKNRLLKRIFGDEKTWLYSDSILIKDLEYQDRIYYKNGRMFYGTAFVDNEYTVSQDFIDGRVAYGGAYACHHRNGRMAFVFDAEDIDNDNRYYDEEGEVISKDMFVTKYPDLIPKAKQILAVINAPIQPKKSTVKLPKK